jgi:hypothetical protein
LVQPSDKHFARLLNLTIKEFQDLKHAPLIEEKNNLGAIIGYFMYISPLNNPEILRKIILTKSNFVWFSVKQVSGSPKKA